MSQTSYLPAAASSSVTTCTCVHHNTSYHELPLSPPSAAAIHAHIARVCPTNLKPPTMMLSLMYLHDVLRVSGHEVPGDDAVGGVLRHAVRHGQVPQLRLRRVQVHQLHHT